MNATATAYKQRDNLINRWANDIAQAAQYGRLDNGRAIPLNKIRLITGPRAAALEIDAGINAGRLLRLFAADESALARQFIPFDFMGEPSVFMAGRYVRVESGWPNELAERDIPLTQIGQRPTDRGRWIVGKTENGATVTAGFSDSTPSWLVAGTSGAGKSISMYSVVCQLSAAGQSRFILIDGKYGTVSSQPDSASLRKLEHLQGVIGPLAVSMEQSKAAILWAVKEMQARYEGTAPKDQYLVIVIDEVQELSTDPLFAEALHRLAAKGREAGVHCLIGTQHPTKEYIGNSAIKANLAGRLALRVMSPQASIAVIGKAYPRADHLLDRGDGYAIAPGATHRVQVAYVPDTQLKQLPEGRYMLDEWPNASAESMGREPQGTFKPTETAISLIAAHNRHGRPKLAAMVYEAGQPRPGGDKAARLLGQGRAIYQALNDQGWQLCEITK